MIIKYTITIILLTLMFSILIYLIIARQKKMWPFKLKNTQPKNVLANTDMNSQPINTPGGYILMIVFLIFIGVIFFFMIKLTMARYSLAGQAMKSGNTGVAMSALAPEIGAGIGSIFHGSN